ncbi:MAG: hypothetical protein KBT03_02010 [Bacteroidales bacterium]|nr:hypothetical protein [Candidatus Scybalousia scybalohippi]
MGIFYNERWITKRIFLAINVDFELFVLYRQQMLGVVKLRERDLVQCGMKLVAMVVILMMLCVTMHHTLFHTMRVGIMCVEYYKYQQHQK